MKHFLAKSHSFLLGALASLVAISPGLAQSANFGSVTVGSSGGSVEGYTAGFFSLSNIAGRDRNGNICAGYADETPDHIMVLQQDMPSLSVQVNSGGNDTTLLIQGPGGSVRCGQDTDRRNPDARVADEGWSAGSYRVWVGTHAQGQQYNYRLIVSP